MMSTYTMLKHYDAWTRKLARARRKADDDIEEDEVDNGNSNADRHEIDVLADLLVEACSPDGEVSREGALRWLLHSRNGAALVARLAQAHNKQQIDRNISYGQQCTGHEDRQGDCRQRSVFHDRTRTNREDF